MLVYIPRDRNKLDNEYMNEIIYVDLGYKNLLKSIDHCTAVNVIYPTENIQALTGLTFKLPCII